MTEAEEAGMMKPTLLERFEAKYIPEPNSGCWLWIAGFDGRRTYGSFFFNKSERFAHRASWIFYRGPIPDGMHVCHKCDNPLCVNPDHLFLGTHKDNMDDRTRKGRGHVSRGEQAGGAKLKTADVLAIRNDRRTQVVLAQVYGVRQATISAIKTRKIWRHVAESV